MVDLAWRMSWRRSSLQADEATEEHAILGSIQFEMKVATNCRFFHETDVKPEQVFAVTDEEEEEAPKFTPQTTTTSSTTSPRRSSTCP